MKAAVYSCVAGLAVAAPSNDVLAKFEEFRTKWGHSYVGIEYHRRLGHFTSTLKQIEDLQRQERGTAIYSHLGPFSDLSRDEMSQRAGLYQTELIDATPEAQLPNLTLPDSFDWVAKGAVNPVKDQGQCGSCWSFSTVCNLEGTGFKSTGRLVSLSEQDIMDCDKTCYSCNGGLPSLALTWSSQNGGVASEDSYPYKAKDESCKNIGKLAHNTGYTKISKDENQIAQALVQYGPLSIAVDATPFQSYDSGVMQNPSCSKTKIDHAVNIVGYGSESSIQYWKIRNSWAASWGEGGYIRVSRGDCTCALCTTVVTATGVTISDSPSPTPPAPPPTPPTCKDKVDWCPRTANWECDYIADECQKSCGCCDSSAPSYCSSTKSAETLTTLALSWTDCGGLAKISSVSPSSLELGSSTTITGTGNSPVTVNSGTFTANIKSGLMPLASCSGPIGPAKTCTLPLGTGSLTLNAVELPINPGEASISMNLLLSSSLPPFVRTTTTHVTVTSDSNQGLVCMDVHLKDGVEV